jgi:hypothetical protein
MNKRSVFYLFVISILAMGVLVGCVPSATPAPTEAGPAKLLVFGAFATPIEEPWDGVIHSALLKAKDEGKVDYEYTDNIGYAGDMERVLRIADQKKPTSSSAMPLAMRSRRRVGADIRHRLCLRVRAGSLRAERFGLRQLDSRAGLSEWHVSRRLDQVEQSRSRGRLSSS